MINKTPILTYNNLSLKYLCKVEWILCLMNFIDFLNIYCYLLITSTQIVSGYDNYDETKNFWYNLSIYYLYKEYLPTNNYVFCGFAITISLTVTIFFYVSLLIIKPSFIEAKGKVKVTLIKLYINFYEMFNFRLLFIFNVDTLITLLIKMMYNSEHNIMNKSTIIVIQFLLLIGIVFVLFHTINHYRIHCVTANFIDYKGTISDFPLDANFSVLFEIASASIKFVMAIEKNLVQIESIMSDKILIFGTIGVLIYIIYFLYFIFLACSQSSSILYYPISNFVIFRFFLISFTGISIIYRMIIKEERKLIFFFFLILTFLIVSTFFSIKYPKIILNRVARTNDLIALLGFMVSNEIDREIMCSKWAANHKIICKNRDCDVCCAINSNFVKEIKFEVFFNVILDVIMKRKNEKKIKVFGHEEIMLDILEIYGLIYKGESQKFYFYMFFYQKFMKYKQNNVSVYFDLLTMFDLNKKNNIEFYKQYENYKETEDVINLYIQFLKKVEDFICYEIKNPKNFIKLAQTLNEFQDNEKIIKLLQKTSQNYTYDITILRFIYESVGHKPIPKSEEFFDISNFEDFLQNHFYHDSFIVVHYGLISKNFTIIKSSHQMRKYLNRSFENLFPPYLRQSAKEKMESFLKDNNFKDPKNYFEFVISDLNEEDIDYIDIFTFKFVMYPSINFGELLISGQFQNSHEDVLIFETINVGKNTKEILISFSKSLSYYFVINPEIIYSLGLIRKTFSFEQIFKKVTASLIPNEITNPKNVTQTIDENRLFFQINFNLFYKLLKKYLEDNKDVYIKEEILNDLKNRKSQISKEKFFLEKKIKIGEKEKSKFTIYVLSKLIKNEKESEKEEENFHIDYGDQINKMLSVGTESVSFSTSSDTQTNKFHIKTINGKTILSKDENRLRRYKMLNIIISIVHVIIVVISLLFLIIQLHLDSNFIEMYEFYGKFHFFKRGIDMEIVRMTSNLCFENMSGEISICYYAVLAGIYQSMFNFNKDELLMSEIVYREFSNSIDNIKNRYTEFKKKAYSLSKKKIKELESISLPVYLIRENDNEDPENYGEIKHELNTPYLVYNYNSFFDSIDLYLNFITQIINRKNLKNISIKFFTLTTEMELKNLNLTNSSLDHKYIYQIVINYPIITKGLSSIKNILSEWFNEHLNSISSTLEGFSVGLVILNISVLVLNCFFIYSFMIGLDKQFKKFCKRLYSSQFMTYFHSKFNHWKNLLLLYDNEPYIEMKKITNEIKEYQKLKEAENKERMNLGSLKKKKEKANFLIYKGYIKQYFFTIFAIYFFFFIIAIILFVLMKKEFYQLKNLIQYYNMSSEIDNYITHNINSLIFMILTNTTQNELCIIQNNYESNTFVIDNFQTILDDLRLVKSIENDNEKIYEKIKDFQNISCVDLPGLEDEIFLSAVLNDEEDNYNSFLIQLCESFDIFSLRKQSLIFKGITFYEQKVLNTITKGDYEEKIQHLDLNDLYGVFTLTLFLVDILRSYQNEIIIPNLLVNTLYNHKTLLIICLTANLIFELVVMILLFILISHRLINENVKMISLLKFFK